MQALLEEIDRRDWQVAVPAGAVAQAWRGGQRQARIAALLSDERTKVVALDDPAAAQWPAVRQIRSRRCRQCLGGPLRAAASHNLEW